MRGAAIHAVVYVAVNALLVALWALAGGDTSQLRTYYTQLSTAQAAGYWPIYIQLFWGTALAFLGVSGLIVYFMMRRRNPVGWQKLFW